MGLLDKIENKAVIKILSKYMQGIFISKSGGDILYSFQVDNSINENLMSQFIAALAMFGEENMGNISRIMIIGLDLELKIIQKYDLILTILFRPNMVQDYLDEEAENGIELFYDKYEDEIEGGRMNQRLYQGFDTELWTIIRRYLVRIGALKEIIGVFDNDFIIG